MKSLLILPLLLISTTNVHAHAKSVTGVGHARVAPCSGAPEPLSVAHYAAYAHAESQCQGRPVQNGMPIIEYSDDLRQMWTCGMGTKATVYTKFKCI